MEPCRGCGKCLRNPHRDPGFGSSGALGDCAFVKLLDAPFCNGLREDIIPLVDIGFSKDELSAAPLWGIAACDLRGSSTDGGLREVFVDLLTGYEVAAPQPR